MESNGFEGSMKRERPKSVSFINGTLGAGRGSGLSVNILVVRRISIKGRSISIYSQRTFLFSLVVFDSLSSLISR